MTSDRKNSDQEIRERRGDPRAHKKNKRPKHKRPWHDSQDLEYDENYSEE